MRRFLFAPALVCVLLLPAASAPPAATTPWAGAGIAISNADFDQVTKAGSGVGGGADRSCFKRWKFTVTSGKYDVEAARDRSKNVFARIKSMGAAGRADLQSAEFDLPPFTEVRLQISVRTEGATGVIALHPSGDRGQVDLALTTGVSGKWQLLRATLRSGATAERHAISLGVVGEGHVDFDALRVERGRTVGAAKGTVLIIDLNDRAPGYTPGPKFWMRRQIAANWGYSVEVMNYHDVTQEVVAKMDPVCLVLTPLHSRTPPKVDPELKKAARERSYKLLQELDRPAIGICLGHQWLGFAAGTRTMASAEKGDVVIKRTGDDPVFEGVPKQYPCSQSHRYGLRGLPKGYRALAETKECKVQVIRAENRPIYGFQGHMERGWSGTTPHGRVLWGNFFRIVEQSR